MGLIGVSVEKIVGDKLQTLSRDELLLPKTWFGLLPELGFNDEEPHELPEEVRNSKGLGLRIWQYPNQFAPYMAWVCSKAPKIRSYLEIGTRHGGTFITHVETLRRLNPRFERAVAVDLIAKPAILESYEYRQQNSQDDQFVAWVNGQTFDLVFVDGDHSFAGVKKDAESTFAISNVQVFHDITSDICPGVGQYWRQYKQDNGLTHDFAEFVDQYDSVQGSFLGIGVAVRKVWFE
jgi:hypothetical protein